MSWFDQRPDDAMMGSFEAVGAEHIHTVEAALTRIYGKLSVRSRTELAGRLL